MTNLDAVYQQVKDTLRQYESKSREETLIRLWDGDWKLIGVIEWYYEHDFKFLLNDAGDATIKLPIDHYLSGMLANPRKWPTKALYVTFDKDGARWSGRVLNTKVVYSALGEQCVELSMIHDYIKLKELLCWPNPFLPAEVQFPKAWVIAGPARWALATTLHCNLIRKNQSLWEFTGGSLVDNFYTWGDAHMRNWNMVVKEVRFARDNSPWTILTSRFKHFHEVAESVVQDAELSIEVRRYLEGDPAPIDGYTLRHGCLVVDIVDKSGWQQGTSFFGNLATGFRRGKKLRSSDGITDHYYNLPNAEFPQEYWEKSFKGTIPSAPWVTLEHGTDSPIEAFEHSYTAPGACQYVFGGKSMVGVNEAIKAVVIGLGGLLGSMIRQSQIGTVAAELLEPLYSDVFLAFSAYKDTTRAASPRDSDDTYVREQRMGWDYPFEHWVSESSSAYSISALIALRVAREANREKYAATVKLTNGAPYYIGSAGFGDFFIGDRVGVHTPGMEHNEMFVERVKSLRYSSKEGLGEWEIEVGTDDYKSGFEYISNQVSEVKTAVKELGVW